MSLTPSDVLERSQWDLFWAPRDAVVVDRPELLYISCPRDVPYLNMVARVRAGPDRLPSLVAEVVQAHAGRRSRWPVLHSRDRASLEAELDRAAYAPGQEHHVYVVAPRSYRRRPAPGIVVQRIGSIEQLRDSHRVRRAAFGEHESPEEDASELARELESCSGPGARVIRFVAYDAETRRPLSAGGINLLPALGFGFLWGGGTMPDARGRGAYSAVLAARINHALRAGLSLVGLFARVDTSAPVVARQGFSRHARMVYWDRPA
jgi:GNAT superfamily N-acetyltransferase